MSCPARISALAVCLALTACGSTPAGSDDAGHDAGLPPGDAGTGTDAGTVVTLLHFNDLHAHLVPHNTLLADGDGGVTVARRGGIARLATLIAQQRAEAPSAVLVNVGDTYHGGVEALYTSGEAVAQAVNALRIDVGVPGNWDYAYGPIVTRVRYKQAATVGLQECIQLGVAQNPGGPISGGVPTLTAPNFPNLAANVTFKQSLSTPAGTPFLPATFTKKVGDVTVGFIGLTSDIVPRMHFMLACGLDFLGADDLASGDAAAWDAKYTQLVQQHAAQLRAAGAQVVVVLSELGLQKDFHLANLLRAGTVDAFLSAHTHETSFTPLVSQSGAWVMEAGDDTWLGRLDLRVANGLVVDRQWKLMPVTASLPEDPAMAQLVTQARAPFLAANPNLTIPGNTGAQLALTEPITTVIGHAPTLLTRKQALDNRFNDFFAESLRLRANTQLGMAPGFRFDEPIPVAGTPVEDVPVADGRVTLEDAYRFFPVVYGMGTAQVTGASMTTVLESAMTAVFSTTIPLQNGGWVEGFAGFEANVSLAAADGARVQSMTVGGASVAGTDSFTIAGCRRPFDTAGVLCSHDGFTNVTDLVKPDGGVWTNVEILRDGLQRPAVNATPALHDLSQVPMWPASPYVQPLGGAK